MSRTIRFVVSLLAVAVLAVGAGWASGTTETGAEEPVLLEVFSMPANTSGFMDNWWADILLEELNVQLELLPSGDQGEQKLQALMAGGELPDVVVFKTLKQVDDAVRARMLVSLDDHLDELPNVAANAAGSLQFMRETASAGTGEAYAVANGIGPGDVGEDLNWGPFLRWDLYTQIGRPEIQTLEDYLPVLKEMQEVQPRTEDGQAVYGITMWKDWDAVSSHQAAQPGSVMGIDAGDQLAGKVPFLQVDISTGETMSFLDRDSQYFRALRFYYEANQLGLIDPDSPTQRFDGAWSKIENGRVLFSWWPWFGGRYNKPENVDADPPRGFRPVLAEEFRPFWWGDNPVGSSWPFAIGSATDDLDAALRYVDYMYSFDGLMTLANGPKGLTWDVDASGEPYVTEEGWNIIENQVDLPAGGRLGDGLGTVNSFGLSLRSTHPGYGVPISHAYWPSSQGRNPTKLLADWQEATGFQNMREMVEEEQGYTVTTLAMAMIPAMPDDILTLSNQIGDIVKTNSWLMMFAEDDAEFEAYYMDMVEKAEGMGIERVLDWGRDAWAEAEAIAANYE